MTGADLHTPALRELMGTYLHQDYDLIGTVEENIDRFIDEFPELARDLPDEVAELLVAVNDERELANRLSSLGCQLLPPDGVDGYRGWLGQIAERVRVALGQR